MSVHFWSLLRVGLRAVVFFVTKALLESCIGSLFAFCISSLEIVDFYYFCFWSIDFVSGFYMTMTYLRGSGKSLQSLLGFMILLILLTSWLGSNSKSVFCFGIVFFLFLIFFFFVIVVLTFWVLLLVFYLKLIFFC